MPKDKIIIAHEKVKCNFNGEDIDPIIEASIKVPLCDNCASITLS